MNRTTKKLTIAAAFLAVASGVASAEVMKADIPFAFRAGRTVMSPGSYIVDVSISRSMLVLRNQDTHENAMILSSGAGDVSKDWTAKHEPVLAFDCGAGRCALTTLWTGSGVSTMRLPQPAGSSGNAPLTLIRLVRPKGN